VAWSARNNISTKGGVVIVTASRSPLDTIAALPLAHRFNAPILYVDPSAVPVTVKTELARLAPRTVYVIGGEGIIDATAFAQVVTASKCPTSGVHRVAGTDAPDTAARVARLLPVPASGQACVVSADEPLDGLALAAWAARTSLPVVFVRRTGVPASTAAVLKERGIRTSLVGASSKVVPDSVAARLPGMRRVAGARRTDACTKVLDTYYAGRSSYPLLVAGGDTPAEAVIAAWASMREGRPLVLTGRKVLPDVTRQWVQNHAGIAFMLSGPASAVDPVVEADLMKAMRMRTTASLSVNSGVGVPASASRGSSSATGSGRSARLVVAPSAFPQGAFAEEPDYR
jgi:hypothetical protein